MENRVTGQPSRDRTYQAVDASGSPIGATITERVLSESGGVATFSIDPLSLVGTGLFQDQMGLGPWAVGAVKAYQYFLTSIPGSVWNNVPTFVRTAGGDFMVFSLDLSAKWVGSRKVYDVRYNGDDGMWNSDGSARLPLCDK
jgi:hypothetical protein